MATTVVYNPGAESSTSAQTFDVVAGALAGKTVSLLDNGWSSYLVAGPLLKEILTERFGAEVVEYHKDMTSPLNEEDLTRVREDSALVITWLGNCGGCTSWSVHDGTELVKAGVPSVSFVTESFVPLAGIVARGKGVANMPLGVLPADFEQMDAAEQRAAVTVSFEQVILKLRITEPEAATVGISA